MKQMKYIIIDNGMYDTPVIFDEATDHSCIANALAGVNAPNVVSAGFVRFTPDGLVCYGKSTSLGIGSAGDVDSKLINKMLGVHDD